MLITEALESPVSYAFVSRPVFAAALALATFLSSPAALAQGGERSGKEVVDAVCSKCHATGVNGAPRLGDKKAWSKRAKQGLSGLTAHALSGIRKMPSHGTDMSLSDFEIKRAVTYMVNQSGGKWVEPVNKKSPAAERTGEQVVKAQCIKCHEDGKGGAPRIGDRNAWAPRLREGLDNTVRSAINGHGGMPARGGVADLTDHEIRGAIIYMFQAPAPKKP